LAQRGQIAHDRRHTFRRRHRCGLFARLEFAEIVKRRVISLLRHRDFRAHLEHIIRRLRVEQFIVGILGIIQFQLGGIKKIIAHLRKLVIACAAINAVGQFFVVHHIAVVGSAMGAVVFSNRRVGIGGVLSEVVYILRHLVGEARIEQPLFRF